MPEAPTDGGNSPAATAYTLVAAAPTSRVAGDNTVQEVISVTATSKKFGVTYTWFVNPTVWTAEGGPPLIALKTSQVNALMQADHVIGFRTVQDQDKSRLLVNYAVISVGTDDGSIYDEVRVRMDAIGTPAAFKAIADTWAKLNKIYGGGLS